MFLFVDKPTAPQDLKPSEVTADSITLTWQTPADNGGSEILEHIIEKKEFNRRTWQQMGTTKDLTFTIPKLLEGNQYFFKVAARNDIGIGEAAETKEAITAKNPFGMKQVYLMQWLLFIIYWWVILVKYFTFNLQLYQMPLKLQLCLTSLLPQLLFPGNHQPMMEAHQSLDTAWRGFPVSAVDGSLFLRSSYQRQHSVSLTWWKAIPMNLELLLKTKLAQASLVHHHKTSRQLIHGVSLCSSYM